MVKLPSPFEVVPTCEPSTITVAPATGFPSGPVTVPEICLLWASESNIPPPNKAINDSRIFLTISVNLIVFFKIQFKDKINQYLLLLLQTANMWL